MRRAALTVAALLLLAPVPAVAGPAESGAAPPERWAAPLPGDVVVARPFERLPHPYAAGHRGVDLRGSPGSAVVAAGDGVVVFAGMVAGRPVVSIDHAGGLRTTYEPVETAVLAGQRVARGSRIGSLATGHAGCPGEACLHWGLRRGETYLDPMSLLQPRRVRLLPRGG
ncbi:UNVERIFIED_ORG: M23 family metallopeptidase [Bacillus sp. AZ43]